MIANDQQLGAASRELEQLEASRARVLNKDGLTEFQRRVEVTGIGKMIDRIKEEIDAYTKAKSGLIGAVVTAQVKDGACSQVAGALVQLRVSKGLRQQDLAQLLGKPQPSIARWESDDYDGYTVKELANLAKALGREVHISFVEPGTSGERAQG